MLRITSALCLKPVLTCCFQNGPQVDLGVLPTDEVVKLLNQTALLMGYRGEK